MTDGKAGCGDDGLETGNRHWMVELRDANGREAVEDITADSEAEAKRKAREYVDEEYRFDNPRVMTIKEYGN